MNELDPLTEQLAALDPDDVQYASQFIDQLLAVAVQRKASDIHLQPAADHVEVKWRIDGVLQAVGTFPAGTASQIVTRVKVLADLLTYRNDLPQEGRIRDAARVEMRVSTFPTLHGERAVVRLFGSGNELLWLDDLGLPAEDEGTLQALLRETAGVILITGPAGSGKTTTAYALMRELVRTSQGTKSLMSLEDPIEVALDGMSQSQIHAASGFDMATGLRSLLRQDPEAILIGEIRDRQTAEGVFQAALTGHLVVSTFHAGSAAEAISRLSDMDIEPYLLRSTLLAIVNQRLVRRLCACAKPVDASVDTLGLSARSGTVPAGCPECHHTGYRGRSVISELLPTQRTELGRAILSRSDAPSLELLATDAGMKTRWQRAVALVESGITSAAEVRRVLGFSSL